MHPGCTPLFTFHYKKSFLTSLERQISESLAIEGNGGDIPLNGKGEWGLNIIPRANYETEREITFKLNRNQRHNVNNVANCNKVKSASETASETVYTHFESQLSQRRKRRRQEEKECNISETRSNIRETVLETRSNTGSRADETHMPESNSPPPLNEKVQGRKKTLVTNKPLAGDRVVPIKLVQTQIKFEKAAKPDPNTKN